MTGVSMFDHLYGVDVADSALPESEIDLILTCALFAGTRYSVESNFREQFGCNISDAPMSESLNCPTLIT